jgi:hypothetical protein
MQHPGGPVPYLTGRWPRAGLRDPAVLALPLSGSKPGEAGSSQQAQGKMAALVANGVSERRARLPIRAARQPLLARLAAALCSAEGGQQGAARALHTGDRGSWRRSSM